MKHTISFILMLLLSCMLTNAQEVNFGINFSPVVGIPLIDKKSNSADALKVRKGNINATGGITIGARFGKFLIETGANASSRTTVFRLNLDNLTFNNLNSSTSISGQNSIRALGHSYSFPLILGGLIHEHDANYTYNVFGLLGAAYEMYTFDEYSFEHATSNSSGSITNVLETTPAAGTQTNWINVVAGFKIRAILLKVGLIEYGLRYHYPISYAGNYKVSTAIANNTYGSVFTGDFYPRLSYLDFHLTYYFLNFKKNEGLKKYRY